MIVVKVLISFFCLLAVISMRAQDYKYFNVSSKGNVYVSLLPKNVTTSLNSLQNKSVDQKQGVYSNKYYVINEEELQAKYYVLYKDVFKNVSEDEIAILKRIQYNFVFDKDKQIVKYELDFPSAEITQFPRFEKQLELFGQKCLLLDLKPYVRPAVENEFQKGVFTFSLLWMIRLDK